MVQRRRLRKCIESGELKYALGWKITHRELTGFGSSSNNELCCSHHGNQDEGTKSILPTDQLRSWKGRDNLSTVIG